MPKKGNYAGLNELTESVFFRPASQAQKDESSPTEKKGSVESVNTPIPSPTPQSEQLPRRPIQEVKKSSTKINTNEINISSNIPRHHDTTVLWNDEQIETIRKAVRRLGKEAATYRFTQEEKKALSDIVYTYKNRGIKTSENEITRTAINYLVEDYHQNGENSMLARMLERLNE